MLSFSILLSVLLADPSAEAMRVQAEQAMARGELERARNLLEAAWAQYATNPTPDGAEERAVAKALASALIGLGRYREAEVWLERLADGMGAPEEARGAAALAELRTQQAVLARLLGDPARSQRLLEEAEALAAQSGDRRLQAHIAFERGELERSREALGLARRHFGQALSLLEALDGDCHPKLLPVLDALARVAREEEDASAWRQHTERAAACAAKLGLPAAESRRAELRESD